jgi:hypothetical protein
MKQVVFAVILIAMASLTGCLNEEDSPVDDKTDDSPSDTTEDNSDTDDELIDPVGGNGGYTPPETASVKLDWTTRDKGEWACTNVGTDEVDCQYTPLSEDTFWNPCPSSSSFCDASAMGYHDADTEDDSGASFMGWVNKTGNTITIEPLTFPYNDKFSYVADGYKFYTWLGRPVDGCNTCEITFYGNDGLTYSIEFNSHESYSASYYLLDGYYVSRTFYHIKTTTIDLPFEPVMFEIGSVVKVF